MTFKIALEIKQLVSPIIKIKIKEKAKKLSTF